VGNGVRMAPPPGEPEPEVSFLLLFFSYVCTFYMCTFCNPLKRGRGSFYIVYFCTPG
jgi:hypothetical protein